MLTECPSCRTVFRVTAAILKMGHGQVRCGKCRTQFDAIECMLDEEELAPPSVESQADRQAQSEPTREPEHESPPEDFATYAEEVTMEGSRIEISGTYRIPDDEHGAEKIVQEHVVIDRGDLPAVDTQPDDLDNSADDEAITEIDLSGAEPLPEEPPQTSVAEAPPVPKRWRRAFGGCGGGLPEIHSELDALTIKERPRALRTGVWTAVCGLAVMALLAQMIHHHRDTLVRDPRFGSTVTRLYRVLGLNATPNWDLAAYRWDIYKVEADPRVPNALRVIGSVANNAAFAQPYPLGKLLLKDRWEMPVGARAFEPYEYLPSPEAADRLMAPKQRANIEIVIVDPGPDAVGYHIDACLEREQRLLCDDQLAAQSP